jgi:hypothetical protein
MMKKVFDTNAEYHLHTSISASGLKSIVNFKGSVREFLAQTYKFKESFQFGNAIHTLLLEGRKKYESEYYELPEIGHLRKTDTTTTEESAANRKLKQQLIEKAGSRICLDYKDVQVIREIERQFYAKPLAVKLCKGDIELSHYTEFEGVPVRVRPDCVNYDLNFISDVKSTKNIMDFERDIWNYGYHVQAAFYCTVLGIPIENFRFVAVKNNMEFDDPRHPETMVRITKLDDRMIEVGFEKMRWAFDRWKHYVETGVALEIDSFIDDLDIEML